MKSIYLIFLSALIVAMIFIARLHRPKFNKVVSLPNPIGEFCVGLTNKSMKLGSRFFSKTKKMDIFYPTTQHNDTTPYAPNHLKNGVISSCKTKVVIPAQKNGSPISAQQFPIIFFYPGAKTIVSKYSILASNLASQGYIVVCLENSDSKMSLINIVYEAYMMIRFKINPAFFTNEILKNINQGEKDLEFIIDHIDKLDISKSWDQKNIILMGHSIGGTIAHRLGFKNRKVTAIVDLDPSYVDLMSCMTHTMPFDLGEEEAFPKNLNKKSILLIHGNGYKKELLTDKLQDIPNLTIQSFDIDHRDFLDVPFLAKKVKLKKQNPGLLWFLKNWLFQDASYSYVDYESKVASEFHEKLSITITDWLKNNRVK